MKETLEYINVKGKKVQKYKQTKNEFKDSYYMLLRRIRFELDANIQIHLQWTAKCELFNPVRIIWFFFLFHSSLYMCACTYIWGIFFFPVYAFTSIYCSHVLSLYSQWSYTRCWILLFIVGGVGADVANVVDVYVVTRGVWCACVQCLIQNTLAHWIEALHHKNVRTHAQAHTHIVYILSHT